MLYCERCGKRISIPEWEANNKWCEGCRKKYGRRHRLKNRIEKFRKSK